MRNLPRRNRLSISVLHGLGSLGPLPRVVIPLLATTFLLQLVGLPVVTRGEDWPEWRGAQRDGVWREEGVIEGKFPEGGLPVKWRAEVSSGYSGPTVARGRVYVTDRVIHPAQTERIHCFDSATGERIWSHEYDCIYTISYEAGPRASVAVRDGKAYALGGMGHLHCLDAESGKVLWKRDLNEEYSIGNRMPIWGIAAAPLLVDNLLILQIGAPDDAGVIALDRESGEEVWRALPDQASYSPLMLVEQAGRQVVLCWTGDSVAGLHLTDGEVLWQHPFPPSRMPIGIATPLIQDDMVFVTSFYDGALMLRLLQDQPGAEVVWRKVGPDERNTEALHSIISTPIWLGDHIYGVDSYGELRCLEAKTGERIWEDLTAVPKARWSTIHFVKHGERVWMFNERGELLLGELSPEGFREIDRAKIIDPTLDQLRDRGGVCWSHPAFAERSVFVRNDQELIRVDLSSP